MINLEDCENRFDEFCKQFDFSSISTSYLANSLASLSLLDFKTILMGFLSYKSRFDTVPFGYACSICTNKFISDDVNHYTNFASTLPRSAKYSILQNPDNLSLYLPEKFDNTIFTTIDQIFYNTEHFKLGYVLLDQSFSDALWKRDYRRGTPFFTKKQLLKKYPLLCTRFGCPDLFLADGSLDRQKILNS